MLHSYIVTYDVSDPKRLRRVFKIMKSYGEHLQLSVFRCELDEMRLLTVKKLLSDAILHGVDQVLIVDMGPTDGRARGAVDAIGKPYEPPDRRALVL
jgi:CRISPR-associated protein Cas2